MAFQYPALDTATREAHNSNGSPILARKIAIKAVDLSGSAIAVKKSLSIDYFTKLFDSFIICLSKRMTKDSK